MLVLAWHWCVFPITVFIIPGICFHLLFTEVREVVFLCHLTGLWQLFMMNLSLSLSFFCTLADCQFWGDAVTIANHCGLECLGIESQWEQDFLCPSRPALRPTQPPLQWVPALFSGVKRPGCGVDHPSLSSAVTVNVLELYLCFPPVPI